MAQSKTKESKTKESPRPKFKLENQPSMKQRELLECFSTELHKFFESSGQNQDIPTRKTVMDKMSEKSKQTLDIRQFDVFLKHLYKDGYLRLGYHRLPKRSEELHKKIPKLSSEDIEVIAGSDPDRFAKAAAEKFVEILFKINETKNKASNHLDQSTLNIGIVSGNTSGAVIRFVRELDWRMDLQKQASSLLKVRVFALNVCLTAPEHLAGNATILAYQLAEKINTEANKKNLCQAYGLSASLLVKKENLREEDMAPQTREILRFTEPYRIREELGSKKANVDQTDTKLDIVLTGVGELPGFIKEGEVGHKGAQSKSRAQGSIYYCLAKQFGFNMERLIARERIVGDIAFTAISSMGDPVALREEDLENIQESDPSSKTEKIHKEAEYLFYSAIQLPTLEAMARDKDKSVILVSRYEEAKNKVPAIFASVAGKHKYASQLIIDEKTAQDIVHY